MNIKPFTTVIRQAPKAILTEANKVGGFITSKLPFVDRGVDSFVKKANLKVGKETIVGGAVFLAAGALAFGCIKTIHSKIKDIRNNK